MFGSFEAMTTASEFNVEAQTKSHVGKMFENLKKVGPHVLTFSRPSCNHQSEGKSPPGRSKSELNFTFEVIFTEAQMLVTWDYIDRKRTFDRGADVLY